MEKEAILIKGFLDTSFVDWPGKVCSVIFLPGCNLRCPYCHNHELIFNSRNLKSFFLKEIMEQLINLKDWVEGVCITGGEPTIHAGLPHLIKEIKKAGFLVKLDTNGTHPLFLKKLIADGMLDYVAMDVKGPLDDFSYHLSAGCAVDVKKIKESIKILKASSLSTEFRTTILPRILPEEAVYRLAHQLKGVKALTLQNFNAADPLVPAFKNLPPYDEKKFQEMQKKVSEIIAG